MTEETKKTFSKYINVTNTLVTIAMGVASWLCLTVISLQNGQARIEEKIDTQKTIVGILKEHEDEITELKIKMEVHERFLDKVQISIVSGPKHEIIPRPIQHSVQQESIEEPMMIEELQEAPEMLPPPPQPSPRPTRPEDFQHSVDRFMERKEMQQMQFVK
jgi:low affinity Fe/Cu permease